jgi:hypothetical protein
MMCGCGQVSVFVRCRKTPVLGKPGGRDNTSILPLEWHSGKLKNLATFESYARF